MRCLSRWTPWGLSWGLAWVLAAALMLPSLSADAQSATPAAGDAKRGQAIVKDRSVGLCLLCHSGPFDDERFQGNLAPPLNGAGSRWTASELRDRIEDSRRFNATSIMPAYGKREGLVRVGAAFEGKPILTPQQIDDVVAFLQTLK
jgi:L-cysteine S-thiosulfotransferase